MKKIFISSLALFILLAGIIFSCKKETDRAVNHPPVANAGADTAITMPLHTVNLSGSASTDPDNNITTYQWRKIDGPSSFSIANANAVQTPVTELAEGAYKFELKVTDADGLFDRDTVLVTVSPFPNQLPVANAGADIAITLPANTVNLSGSASTDPDNNITTYQWTKIVGPASLNIANANSVATQVTNLTEGVYQFELKVTDAGGLFSKDTIIVTVNPDLSLAIEWQKALGGTGTDIAQFIQRTADGGYILAGSTNSQNGDVTGYHPGAHGCYQTCFSQEVCEYFPDALVMKLSSAGAIQWQKSLGGSGAEHALYIQPTADGGYIMSGYTYSNDGDVSGYHGGDEADAWVVKLSSSGTVQWQKVLGGGTGCDFANVVLPTPDGGYILAGHTDSHDGDVVSTHGERDVWIVKLSSNGAMEWQKALGGTNNDYAYAFQSTPDGGYIVAGNTDSNDGDVSGNHGGQDVWVVKLNSSGAIQWQKALGGTNNEDARSIQPTADGGYIVAGQTKSNDGDVSGKHGGGDVWIVKLSSIGAIQWQKPLGGTNNEESRSIHPTTDGGYIIAGQASSNDGNVTGNHGDIDAWVIKLKP